MIRYRKSRLSENRNIRKAFRNRRLNENNVEYLTPGDKITNGGYRYEVIIPDVWGNEEDGWEVNDIRKTGEFYSITNKASDDEVLSTLVNDEWISRLDKGDVSIEFEDGDSSLWVIRTSDDKPLLKLQTV
jgi:hypothetical protein